MVIKGSVVVQYVKELIDTLWNVNQIQNYSLLSLPERINRYIMECKYLI